MDDRDLNPLIDVETSCQSFLRRISSQPTDLPTKPSTAPVTVTFQAAKTSADAYPPFNPNPYIRSFPRNSRSVHSSMERQYLPRNSERLHSST
ncbi:hypothetical protein PM082_009091 [Marasmius tenuissimus]|nr:hypothetical protein PM082_009091 [Marasmius tenuissimus]